jgi:hypothetical protein
MASSHPDRQSTEMEAVNELDGFNPLEPTNGKSSMDQIEPLPVMP